MNSITTLTFGPDVTGDAMLMQALERSVPQYIELIASIPTNVGAGKGLVSIKEVHSIASNCLGENISALNRAMERRLCFEVLFVSLLASTESLSYLQWSEVSQLVEKYPALEASVHVTPYEQGKLLQFRNMMVFAQMVIQPANHKTHLMELVTRVCEGRHQKYITGSGETRATRNRVLIYRVEGCVEKTPRPPRKERVQFAPVSHQNQIPATTGKRKLDQLVELCCGIPSYDEWVKRSNMNENDCPNVSDKAGEVQDVDPIRVASTADKPEGEKASAPVAPGVAEISTASAGAAPYTFISLFPSATSVGLPPLPPSLTRAISTN